ncbi:metal-sensing transcriptional repressor [Staphylococcus aureus]|uniref:metal-sensing transcriptional repressor n=1 Tax=Staphylococcus aureus TaxID=1280 RepID=UPI003520018B
MTLQQKILSHFATYDNFNSDDVLTQIRATRSALNSVAIKLLEQHMKSGIMNKVNQGAQEEAMEELLVTFQKLIKD